MFVPASATPRVNIESSVDALKSSQTEMQTVKIEFEQQIAALQAKMQPETPPEVRVQRAALVK